VAQTAYQPSPAPPKVGIDGQINGYWIEPEDDVPSVRPPYDPTGALLIAELTNADETHNALSLVRRNDGTYGPVSHAAVLTYLHTTGMLDGETWRFAVYAGNHSPTVYECLSPLGEASQEAVGLAFGSNAGNRARDDYPTIVFRVRQLDAQ
jgi:hypothetical protein